MAQKLPDFSSNPYMTKGYHVPAFNAGDIFAPPGRPGFGGGQVVATQGPTGGGQAGMTTTAPGGGNSVRSSPIPPYLQRVIDRRRGGSAGYSIPPGSRDLGGGQWGSPDGQWIISEDGQRWPNEVATTMPRTPGGGGLGEVGTTMPEPNTPGGGGPSGMPAPPPVNRLFARETHPQEAQTQGPAWQPRAFSVNTPVQPQQPAGQQFQQFKSLLGPRPPVSRPPTSRAQGFTAGFGPMTPKAPKQTSTMGPMKL